MDEGKAVLFVPTSILTGRQNFLPMLIDFQCSIPLTNTSLDMSESIQRI